MSASWVSPPKSTMFEIVEATDEFTCVMMKTPRKLKMALMMMAGRTFMQRVEMQVAIAFGASVQPLTKMTPKVKRTDIAMIGLVVTCSMNWVRETSKTPPPPS